MSVALSQTGWRNAPIGSLCKLVNGRAFKPTDWQPDGLPIIRIQNLNKPDAPFNRFAGQFEPKYRVQTGDLLFAWSGTPGTSFGAHVWTRGEAILNQHIFNVLYDSEKVDRDYFKLAINYRLDELIAQAHGGAGLAHITKGRFEATEVPLPPLPEQRRIVSRVDALFARTRRARADLERIAPLTRQHEAQALASLIEDEDSGSPVRCLHELLVEPAANGISIRGSDEPPGTPALRLDALTPHGLDLTRRRFIDIPESAVKRLTIRENDFLVSRGNGSLRLLARGAFAHAPATPTVFPDTMIRLRFRPDLVCPAWLTLAWRSAAVRKQVEQKAKTTAGIWKVSQTDLGSIELRVPTLKQQQLIATFLQRRLDTVAVIEGQSASALALLDRLERSILARAFRGELVPQDAS